MLEPGVLQRWCAPNCANGPFLRPFVARGPLVAGGAFIVGINPATRIGPSDGISLNDYAASLTDIESFLPIYSRVRIMQGKTRPSSTRRGLDSASEWLMARGFPMVLDTNVSPYPTRTEKEWEQLPEQAKAMHVLPELVRRFRPALVLLHGKGAYERFTHLYAPQLRLPGKFNAIVAQRAYLGKFKWDDGTGTHVYVSKHLRFFGKGDGGEHFASLRQALAG